MVYLSAITLLWAFSFSLIGVYLAGQVDAWFSVFTRVALACLVFIPFTQWRGLSRRLWLPLMGLGAVQLGVMYGFYYQSFLYLSVSEVLLFTIFTPLYITLIYDALKGRFSPWYLSSAAIAVAGTAIIQYASLSEQFWVGFFIVQGANLCFAIGQVGYKFLIEKEQPEIPQHKLFGWFYLGALSFAIPAFLLKGNVEALPSTAIQWGILVYLGIFASGMGYFVWNKGATQVNAGLLAVMNNALVPCGLVVNILIWNRDVDLTKLAIGSAIIAFSVWWNEVWVKRRLAATTTMASVK
ncbi:carboxylate/amino acid/amine transporter [Thaumasiovibrio subtropicus]|uniref:carboxylate/amino acid/amine transporter n=1 Tax=Thaumasiovibrio subtropicus TaxID=1891207 RepID=UPI000B363BBC|nr:carboxylate/amino acid/amine transporter [Thaumasiovibrio subtropicus]